MLLQVELNKKVTPGWETLADVQILHQIPFFKSWLASLDVFEMRRLPSTQTHVCTQCDLVRQ